ncbi:MAG: hypothetical protein RL562_1031 [Planctomycetota bacterium]|jgi:hypothetical protein
MSPRGFDRTGDERETGLVARVLLLVPDLHLGTPSLRWVTG